MTDGGNSSLVEAREELDEQVFEHLHDTQYRQAEQLAEWLDVEVDEVAMAFYRLQNKGRVFRRKSPYRKWQWRRAS